MNEYAQEGVNHVYPNLQVLNVELTAQPDDRPQSRSVKRRTTEP